MAPVTDKEKKLQTIITNKTKLDTERTKKSTVLIYKGRRYPETAWTMILFLNIGSAKKIIRYLTTDIETFINLTLRVLFFQHFLDVLQGSSLSRIVIYYLGIYFSIGFRGALHNKCKSFILINILRLFRAKFSQANYPELQQAKYLKF